MSQSKSSEKFDGSFNAIFLNMTAYNEAVKIYIVVVIPLIRNLRLVSPSILSGLNIYQPHS